MFVLNVHCNWPVHVFLFQHCMSCHFCAEILKHVVSGNEITLLFVVLTSQSMSITNTYSVMVSSADVDLPDHSWTITVNFRPFSQFLSAGNTCRTFGIQYYFNVRVVPHCQKNVTKKLGPLLCVLEWPQSCSRPGSNYRPAVGLKGGHGTQNIDVEMFVFWCARVH